MDSLTQIVLGAGVAALAVPPTHRRAALLAGAMLGTLPDLDVLPLALLEDPVARMTWHRSFSHSLLTLLPFGVLCWFVLRARWKPVREAPQRWLWAILLALATHPLLDAHTVYGTQLFWPLPHAPLMWSTVFIIDPLYTLPLLYAVLVALRTRIDRLARTALIAGMSASSGYLLWAHVAKASVDAQMQNALAAQGLAGAPRFSVPTPFNTWVWRVVALTPQGYLEGTTTPFRASPIRLVAHPSDVQAEAAQLASLAAIARMRWFASGFVDLRIDGDIVVLRDLRMGAHPDFFFQFDVAQRDGEDWAALQPARQRETPPASWERMRELWRVE